MSEIEKNEIGIGTLVFGNWTIKRILGQGSCGIVYEIERKQYLGAGQIEVQKQTAALKVLQVVKRPQDVARLKGMGLSQQKIDLFFQDHVRKLYNEIEIMYPLKGHSNIVGYEDHEIYTRKNGTGWDILMRMELLLPLGRYASLHPLSKNQVLQLGIDICQALEACEKLNIIHRDIKPENVFVNRFHTFKLGDFGIAKIAEDTAAGTLTGTYGYMAPEVLVNQNYNATVDIYSLGIMLYQYLNQGRLPFLPPVEKKITMKDMEAASAARLSGKPIPMIDEVDTGLNMIIRKACSFRPEERYQTATELKKALEGYRKEREYEDYEIETDCIDEMDFISYVDGEPVDSSELTLNIAVGTYDKKSSIEMDNMTGKGHDEEKSSRHTGLSHICPFFRKKTWKTVSLCFAIALIMGATAVLRQRVSSAKDGTPELMECSECVAAESKEVIDDTLEKIDDLQITKADFPVSVGDYVKFGSYEQDNFVDNGTELLEWKVLDIQGDEALLLCRYGFDVEWQQNRSDTDISWEKSNLRRWLNYEFLNTAFTEAEQTGIQEHLIENKNESDKVLSSLDEGNSTLDRAFCLSWSEYKQYFHLSNCDRYEATEYEEMKTNYFNVGNGQGSVWWLRSVGKDKALASGANAAEEISVNEYRIGIRPCIWVSERYIGSENENKSFKPGNDVFFGNYEQDGDIENGKEPIEWVILEQKDDALLLISRYVLDNHPFYVETWEKSILRHWLNGEFFTKAFSENERAYISPHCNTNLDYTGIESLNGADCYDFVFCLSQEEAVNYLNANDLLCKSYPETRFSGEMGLREYAMWWLRTCRLGNPMFVDSHGKFRDINKDGEEEWQAIRPAMWVKLSGLTPCE